MTNPPVSPAASAAREAAPATDGKFGSQPAPEADLELAADPTVYELQDLRTEIGARIVDAQGAGNAQADFEASAAYQRATLKMVGTALRASGSGAESLSFQPGEDDPWVLSSATDREGNVVDVGDTVPGSATTPR
ncbi:hypothetical protein [Kocuria sp. CH-021]|uniref:hypothetical protein n=1 Tax=Kocuria sp. CH-021 TaxID=3406735 RepID=UPI003C776945